MAKRDYAAVVIIILLFAFLSPIPIFAETLKLKWGEKVEGKIIERTDEYIKIEVAGKPLSYLLRDIAEINNSSLSSAEKPPLEEYRAVKEPAAAGPESKTGKVNCVINRSQIGGADLKVYSLYDAGDVPVKADGTAAVTVSAKEAQIITVADQENKIRALSVFIPGYTEAIVFDAASTAKSDIFKMLSDADKKKAELSWIEIEKQPCYSELLDFYKNNLVSNSIDDLTQREEYLLIKKKCFD